MAHYRYLFLQLRDEVVIEEIPLFGVYMRRQLNDAGQFNGSFSFDMSGKNNADLVAATTPGKTWIVVERDDVPVWWGFVWSRTYQSQAKECQIFGWGFEAYPQKQKIISDYVKTGGSALTTTAMFADLWSHMQLVPGRNVNINVPSINYGNLKELTVLATDNNYYWDAMDALASASDGFDWTIDLTKDTSGAYYKTLRIGSPTIGVTPDYPYILTFEYPGSILNYYVTESLADSGTHITAHGAGEGSSMPSFTFAWSDLVSLYGWPRWDVDISYKDITSQTQIQALAERQAIVRKVPMPTFKVTVKGDLDPVVGTYNVGDACNLVITDSRFPSPGSSQAGLNVSTIVLGWELRPPASDGTEEVNLIFPGDVVNG